MQTKAKTYSLFELNQLVKQTITEQLADSYWVIAEISELKEHSSGHCYLELIQKDDDSDTIRARARATIWAYSYRMLKPYFESATGRPLSQGLKVMVLAQVSFHEIYSYSLNITDIEPTFTVGDIELRRRETINRLIADGVYDMNRELTLEMLPFRIAVISSPQAAGYEDFLKQLTQNRFGYHFKITLFNALMQGRDAEDSIITALANINKVKEQFDLVAIVRGGGATADLSCFDSYNLANHIAQFPLPVITGIGHDKDITVADLVAYKTLKTPTAVAEFIIEQANEAENYFIELRERLIAYTTDFLETSKDELIQYAEEIKLKSLNTINQQKNFLTHNWAVLPSTSRLNIYKNSVNLKNYSNLIHKHLQTYLMQNEENIPKLSKKLEKAAKQKLIQAKQKETYLAKIVETLDPKNTLKKGFTITRINGKAARSVNDVGKNAIITTQFHDGEVISRTQN